MFHTIEFNTKVVFDLQVSWSKPLEKVSLRKGTRLRVQIKPYVAETKEGFVEMADLYFEDGTATAAIPFAFFSFVE